MSEEQIVEAILRTKTWRNGFCWGVGFMAILATLADVIGLLQIG